MRTAFGGRDPRCNSARNPFGADRWPATFSVRPNEGWQGFLLVFNPHGLLWEGRGLAIKCLCGWRRSGLPFCPRMIICGNGWKRKNRT